MKKRETPVIVTVPGSKSITNRALLLAAMSEGTSILRGCMTSDDARVFLESLKTLGLSVNEKEAADSGIVKNIDVTIEGCGGVIPRKEAELYVGSAGTAARFLVAMLALSDGRYLVDSSEQMKKRPMQPLIDALRGAGAKVECAGDEGHFPLKIEGTFYRAVSEHIGTVKEDPDRTTSGTVRRFHVNIDQSSQFLSALLIAAGTLKEDVVITSEGSHGLAYVDMTVELMRSFGVEVETEKIASEAEKENAAGQMERETIKNGRIYRISSVGRYQAGEYDIEPDMSAAAYFYAAAAICGSSAGVCGVKANMLQGDTEFLQVLEKMGCKIRMSHTDDAKEKELCEVIVDGPDDGKLHGGFTIDMSEFSDQALTLAAIAPYADAPVTITGIGHIRLQESDRIRAINENLTRMGISVTEREDGVTVEPGTPHAAVIDSYDDHRVAMSFALCGLRTDGIEVRNKECCRKTFAEYFEVLEQVRKELTCVSP